MEIRKLDWDSYFFDFPIGYIFIDKEPPSNFSKILNFKTMKKIILNFFQIVFWIIQVQKFLYEYQELYFILLL